MSVFSDVEKFYQKFNGEKTVIGNSLLGKPIYAMCVEKTARPLVIAQYAIHARDYVTSYLALKQIKEYQRLAKVGKVYFIPLLNPDGVEICEKGRPFYKANGRGVDLNVNFDARWGEGESNITCAGEANYVGKFPFSEPESRAIERFTTALMPDMTISYHSKGREVYWYFGQKDKDLERDHYLSTIYAISTGYVQKRTPNSTGGYKDWCIEKLKIPALTIEAGDDNLRHPIKKRYAKEIYLENKGALIRTVLALSEKRWNLNL